MIWFFNRRRQKQTTPEEQKLLDGVERAGESLRTILKDNSITLKVIQSHKDHPVQDYKEQWGGDKGSRFDGEAILGWADRLKIDRNFRNIFNENSLYVALYSNETLCGLCKYGTPSQNGSSARVNIEVIESARFNTSLSGYVITAFSQVALELANDLNAQTITVFAPREGTEASYTRIGFDPIEKTGSPFGDIMKMPLTNGSQINWNAAFQHQKQKGRPAPNDFG